MRLHATLATLLLLLGLPASGRGLSPAEAAAAALADAQRITAAAPYARYLHKPVAAAGFKAVLDGHVNCLSVEGDFARLRPVAEGLWALDVRDYGKHWGAVYEKLAALDPYYHTKVVVEKVVDEEYEQEYGYFAGPDGRPLPKERGGVWKTTETRTETRKARKKVRQADALFIPGAPKQVLERLAALTQSQCPLLRADWFFAQTARQRDRFNVDSGAGYYDFLGVKKEADLEELAGVDRKKAQKARHDIAAIIAESGVALNNRQVFRVAEGYWETRDVAAGTKAGNALRQLDADFVPQAKEVYARLPNGLWALAAVKADDGTLQAVVPPEIASDAESTSNDRQIHPGLSCIRCHVEGLRPLNDWARQFYANPPGDAVLQSPDYEKLKRLRQLYLSPLLDTYYQVDQMVYARAVFALTGLSPGQFARAYGRAWREYADTPVTAEALAAELGTTVAELRKALAAAARAQGQLDPVLTGYLKVPAFKASRVHVEEAFPAAALAVAGYVSP